MRYLAVLTTSVSEIESLDTDSFCTRLSGSPMMP
jgi:hypothetical protein